MAWADYKLLLHLNGADASTATEDASDSGHAVTFYGTAQLDTAYKKWGTAALLVDGDSDYLQIADSADWDIFSPTDAVVDFWIRHTDHVGAEAYICQIELPTDYWLIYHYHTAGMKLLVKDAGSTIIDTGWKGEITDTAWHHIACCKVGTSYGLYKDGAQISYATSPNAPTFAAPLQIGEYGTYVGYHFDGHIDEVRISHYNEFGAAPVAGTTDTIVVPTKEYSTPDVTITPDAIVAEAKSQTPTIAAERNITISPDIIGILAQIQAPTIIATRKFVGFDYRIELRDSDFNRLSFLENEATDTSWQYNRIGGCGAFSFTLPRRFDDQGNLGGNFDVRIYKKTYVGTYTLWYSGFIEDRMPNLSEPEKIDIKGFGYSAQLSKIIIDKTYTSDEISVIIKDILDTFIVPNTDIAYDASDIEATTFTADTLTFNTTALNAIKTLAEIAGTREWGVDKDRNFFFKARSSVVNFYYDVGHKIMSFSNIDSFREIINRIYIEGGEVGGTKYERTVNDTASQAKYGLLEQIYQNSAITTGSVADQFGEAILAEKSDLARRGKLALVNELTQTEDAVPLGTLVFRTVGVRYGEKKYGTFLYSGNVAYQINKISYRIDDNKTLIKTLDLGQLRPSVSEEIEQLSFELEQLRMARA